MATKSQQLLSTIRQRNAEYRAGKPTISDQEYDALVDELYRIDPDNEWFKHIEPAPVASSRKVKLPIPMKSLKKVKSLDELKSWLTNIGLQPNDTIVITPKFDGLSLLYDEKKRQAFSRGGSENEGQDCSEHIKMAMIPECQWSKLHYTFGEFVFRKETWENTFAGKTSSETGEKYKSPRNTAAGLLNRDEPHKTLRFIDFFRYGTDKDSLTTFNTYLQLYEYLCREYGQSPLYLPIKVDDLESEILNKCFQNWSEVYYCDGLVIYVNDLKEWQRLGRQETTGNPNYAIAYKHPDFTPTFETTVKGVNWKISKAGAFKPVVNIDTVDTGDCEMENPTGYNAKYIFENSIGTDAIISVTRSGGVIPKILEVIEEAPSDTMLNMREELLYCPHCGKPTVWNDTKVELVCVNPDCPGVRLAKIVHFYNTLNTEQMGEETITKMFNAGYNTLCRILDITFDELMMIEGFGESIANIILSANKSIRAGLEITKLMHASDCFQGIGQVKAKQILSGLSEGDLYAFVNGLVQTKDGFDQSEQFQSLPKTTQNFLKGITPFYEFVAQNRLAVLPMEAPTQIIGDKYKGIKVCFSGVRDKKLEAEIISQGGEVVSGVSKKTTHLVVADKDSSSSKATKAKSLGIPILTISEFIAQ